MGRDLEGIRAGTRSRPAARGCRSRQPDGPGSARRRLQSRAADDAAEAVIGTGRDAALALQAAPMIDLFETARQLQAFCDGQAWRSCFIGGVAVQRWGEPRLTRDVDLTLLTGFGGEAPFI